MTYKLRRMGARAMLRKALGLSCSLAYTLKAELRTSRTGLDL